MTKNFLIKDEFDRCMALPDKNKTKLVKRMREYAAACWQTCEKMHLLMLDDDQPENEKQRLDPDHWYVSFTNQTLSLMASDWGPLTVYVRQE